jgi:hypothetical protein
VKRYLLRKDGKVVFTSGLTDEQWVKIKRLHDEGMSITMLASRFGVTYSAIRNRLKAEEKKPKQRHRSSDIS